MAARVEGSKKRGPRGKEPGDFGGRKCEWKKLEKTKKSTDGLGEKQGTK